MEYQPMASMPAGTSPAARGYLECAEWCGLMPLSETDHDGESAREALELMVRPHWSTEAVAEAEEVCRAFAESITLADLEAYHAAGYDDESAGHDLWLTRNGHGAGFWDRGLGEVGERMSAMARPYGGSYVWLDVETETLSLS